jgi:hypothetical protein
MDQTELKPTWLSVFIVLYCSRAAVPKLIEIGHVVWKLPDETYR